MIFYFSLVSVTTTFFFLTLEILGSKFICTYTSVALPHNYNKSKLLKDVGLAVPKARPPKQQQQQQTNKPVSLTQNIVTVNCN